MEEIILKINNTEDLDEILLVSEAVFKPNEQEREKYENKSDWLEKIKNGLLVSAVIDNKIVGFSICYKKEDDFHVWKVGVLDEFRGIGIWRKMYDEIIKYAAENGFQKVTKILIGKGFRQCMVFARRKVLRNMRRK